MVGMTMQQDSSFDSESLEDSPLHFDWKQESSPLDLRLVEDLPLDSDWETWIKDAVCFSLTQRDDLKIYGVNPNDCSCYHLASFSFSHPADLLHGKRNSRAFCTIIGFNLYFIGRDDAYDHNLTELWIWDIAEAQKKKLTGEPYEWKLGPRLNSGKSKVLAFSIGGDLYALDILRSFYRPSNREGQLPIRKASEVRDENPVDFERLQISSSSRNSPLSWVSLPPLQIEKYRCSVFNGYYCLRDRLLLHMYDENPLESYLFCFNVTTNKWSHQRFYSLPLTTFIPIDELDEPQLRCNQYSAQVENYGLFLKTRTGELLICDFRNLCDWIENGFGSKLKFPFFPIDIDQNPLMKDIVHGTPFQHFYMFQTVCLGGERNCWLAFYEGYSGLCLKICIFDLKKKTLVETYAKKSENQSKKKKEMTENTVFSAVNVFCRRWNFESVVRIMPLKI